MFRNLFAPNLKYYSPIFNAVRNYVLPPPVVIVPAHPSPKMKATIVGSSGSIGQHLSLLMKHSTILTELNLHDMAGAPAGIAIDLNHIETRVKVKGFQGDHELGEALEKTDIVLITAGTTTSPGMTQDDIFDSNATVIYEIMHACAANCPKAIICIVSNPINSLVPVAAEVLKSKNVFDPNRLFGVTVVDVVRANAFIAQAKNVDPACVFCPVIGGHSSATMIPLLSQCSPTLDFTPEEVVSLTEQIQDAEKQVVSAKSGPSTLSVAYSAARFAFSLMRAIRGEAGVKECAFVKTDVCELPYFSIPIELGPDGIENNLGIGILSVYEKELLKKAVPNLKNSIERGLKFIKTKNEE